MLNIKEINNVHDVSIKYFIFAYMRYIIFFIISILFSCSSSVSTILVNNTGYTQGTFYHIQYISEDGKDYKSHIDSLLNLIDYSLSTWEKTSVISRANKGVKVKIDKMFSDVFYAAEKVYNETDGEFDCSIAPLTNYWGFGPEQDSLIFDSSEVLRRLNLVDYSRLNIIDDSLLMPTGMQLDYNSIAQGYSVDVVAHFLKSQGVTDYLVEIGGELSANGYNADNEIWLVGIEKPTDNLDEEYQVILPLYNSSLATSGNYRKYKEINGIKYSHTINSKTGYFAKNRMLSATVIHSSCMLSDAYATAFMAMGVKRSKDFLDTHPELDAYLVYSDIQGNWKTFITQAVQKEIID